MSTLAATLRPPGPSPLAGDHHTFAPNRVEFFVHLFGPIKTLSTATGVCEYIPLGNRKNLFLTDSLIIRPCYDHILPHIHNRMLGEVYMAAVTGSSGIGKSVFGALLLRHYVLQNQSVVYWEKDDIYLFSFNPRIKAYFGLENFREMGGTMCYARFWNAATARWPEIFYSGFDIVFIHDPKMGDTRVHDNADTINRLIYILSYDHMLIRHWNTNGGAAEEKFELPLWSLSEAKTSLPLLKKQNAALPNLAISEVDELYRKFGGCIRGWLAQGEAWGELDTEINEVVKNRGDDILAESTASGGSLFHEMSVAFRDSREKCPFSGADQVETGRQVEEAWPF